MIKIFYASLIFLVAACNQVEKADSTTQAEPQLQNEPTPPPSTPKDTGVINSVVDGVEWKDEVVLWSSASQEDRVRLGYVMPKDTVYLLYEVGNYDFIQSAKDPLNTGFVLRGWVNYNIK